MIEKIETFMCTKTGKRITQRMPLQSTMEDGDDGSVKFTAAVQVPVQKDPQSGLFIGPTVPVGINAVNLEEAFELLPEIEEQTIQKILTENGIPDPREKSSIILPNAGVGGILTPNSKPPMKFPNG